jgi:hypothetical protein
MQILKTMDELVVAVGDNTFGWLAFDKKQSASVLHPGHEYLVSYSKANFDLTIINFWEMIELMYSLYKLPYLVDKINLPWDSTGCLAWCEAQGVDFVFLPDPGYSQQYFLENGVDGTSMAIYEYIEQVWYDHNYMDFLPTPTDASKYNTMIRSKTFVAVNHLKPIMNTRYISTWKDGEPRFTMADYITRDSTSEIYVLLDPVITPDGLYYSSGYFSYTEAQKDLLKQIDGVVDSIGYSDTTALTVALTELNTGAENFVVNRIDVLIGGVVGEANDFIDVKYIMDGYPDSYPVYKKGVR